MSGWLSADLAREVGVSAAILVASYAAARLVSFLLGRVLAHAASRTGTSLDDRLIQAVKRPLTYSLFLVGAYTALHRLPVHERWIARLDQALFTLGVLVVALGAIRAYGVFVSWYANESRLGAENALAREFSPLLSKLGKVAIALVGLITILEHFHVNVNSLVVSLGVGSLAVGLAAQDTLANLFAGFTLMLDRPFKIGDRIQLATGEVGDVVAIGIRATRMKTLDETLLVIPNSLLVKERLLNLTLPSRRLTARVEVGVAYGSDVSKVRQILAESALASRYVEREPAPAALLTRFADFALVFRLVFFSRDYTEHALAVSEVHEEIYRRLGEAGIEIPFPVRRVIQEKADA